MFASASGGGWLPTHLIAAALDDVGAEAAEDVVVALRVDDGQIPRLVPAVGSEGLRRGIGAVPVALRDSSSGSKNIVQV